MSQQEQPPETEVSLKELLDFKTDPFDVRLEDIHGLEDDVARIREAFIPTVTAQQVEVRTPSVLLHGPEGTGKSRVARAITSELADFNCTRFSPDRVDQLKEDHHLGSEEIVAHLIEDLPDFAPVVLILEDLERLRVRDDGPFHTAIDALRTTNERVAVVCLLTRDGPHLNRQQASEYFDFADFRIHVPHPDDDRCMHVLNELLADLAENTAITIDVEIDPSLSKSIDFEMTHLHHVGRRAVILAQARSPNSPIVTKDDVEKAITQLSTELTDTGDSHGGSIAEEFQPAVPTVTFDDVGGLNDVIQRLRELVTYPRQYADLYADSYLEPANGILLHGPPGTGKTLLAKALATETERTFYAVEGAAVKSMWFGQSEERIHNLFDAARNTAPSLIFFDEFDALAGTRDRASHSTVQSIVNTLLAELDGVAATDDMVVVAATNRPDAIDPAITRSGRIGESMEVPPPDERGRQEIFRIQTQGLPMNEEVTAGWFARTVPDGVTGADIAAIVERAVHYAINAVDTETATPAITRQHLRLAVDAHREDTQSDCRAYH